MVFGEISIPTDCCRIFNWNKDVIFRNRRGSKKQSLNLADQGIFAKADSKVEEKPSR